MGKLSNCNSISRFLGIGKSSDIKNTDLENGIEYGFGFVLGATSAVVIIMLLFFVLKSVIMGL